MNASLNDNETFSRLGGDEFGVILENCGLQQAAAIADKIRQKIKNYRFVWLALAAVLSLFVGGRWPIPIAATFDLRVPVR